MSKASTLAPGTPWPFLSLCGKYTPRYVTNEVPDSVNKGGLVRGHVGVPTGIPVISWNTKL